MSINIKIKNEVVALYNSGIGSTTIARQLGIGETTVLRILKQHSIPIREASLARRTYNLNENYFDSIDTEDKAYFLGLLYADGNNYTKKFNAVHLGLKEEDGYLVKTFASLIYGESKIPYKAVYPDPNHSDQLRIRIYNKHLSEQLSLLGCVSNKSLILKFPDFINRSLIHHFIRGYFDGDGSISIEKRQYRVQIISSPDFCSGLKRCLESVFDIKSHYNKRKRNGFLSIYKKAVIKKFINVIYKGSNEDFRLRRKYDLCMLFISNMQKPLFRNTSWSKEEEILLLQNIKLPTRKLRIFFKDRSGDSIEKKKARLKTKVLEGIFRGGYNDAGREVVGVLQEDRPMDRREYTG